MFGLPCESWSLIKEYTNLTLIRTSNEGEANPVHLSSPEQFDIWRHPNGRLFCGHGIHFCLGAALVRIGMKVALEALLKLMPVRHIVNDQLLRMVENHTIFGVKELHIMPY